MTVDLSKYTLVIDENFDSDLNIYDGTSGLWSTTPRRDVLATNGPRAVFLSENTPTNDGVEIGINPLSVEDGLLKISSGIIPDTERDAVVDSLELVGQGHRADNLEYYTGMITTGETWSQTYGYFEISAEIPEGRGLWPAFWLAAAGEGWPPEIDIFEAYGRSFNHQKGADDLFNAAVFYDAVDADGNADQTVDLTNPYVLDADGNEQLPDVRTHKNATQYVFHEQQNALEEFGIDIYNGYSTWALEWTPDHITFYFGPDADNLIEVYKTPTPEDLTAPMVLIANNQVSSPWGFHPSDGYDHLTFAEDNTFNIDYIKSYVLTPEDQFAASTLGETIVEGDGDSQVIGSAGNDRIAVGEGLDIIDLRGGSDTVFVEKGIGNKIIDGFGPDDRIVLDNYFFDGVGDILARLTQVGNDVWLANGADPADPQTIIFRDAAVNDFTADNFVPRWSVTENIWNNAQYDGKRVTDADNDGHIEGRGYGTQFADISDAAGPVTITGTQDGDNYYIYRADTQIVEQAGGGVDTVYVNRDHTLADNVENVTTSTSKDGIVLTGNTLGNRIEGAEGGDVFIGAGGDDLIITGGGANRIVYRPGDGHDAVVGFGAQDVLALEGITLPSWNDLQARLVASGEDTVVDLGEGQSVLLRGVVPEQLGEANFSFDIGPLSLVGNASDPSLRPSAPAAGDPDVAPDIPVPPPSDLPPQDEIIPEPPEPFIVNNTVDDLGPVGPQVGTSTNDEMAGSEEADWIAGKAGDDEVVGGAGDDTLRGDAGNDTVYGGADEDKLLGNEGNDTLFGGDGDDRLRGNAGDDVLHGDAGNDHLSGSTGADVLFGGDGDDRVIGGEGNDRLNGGEGADLLRGGTGDDVLDGGFGSDKLRGEEGADRFVLGARRDGEFDRILDFNYAEGDRIDVSAFGTDGAAVSAVQKGVSVVLYVEEAGASDPALLARVSNADVADVQAALIW